MSRADIEAASMSRLLAILSESHSWILVETDELSPSLPDGCAALIDEGATYLEHGQIHLMEIEGQICIGRLFDDGEGGAVCIPDNAEYPVRGFPPASFKIRGQAIGYFWSRGGIAIRQGRLYANPIPRKAETGKGG